MDREKDHEVNESAYPTISDKDLSVTKNEITDDMELPEGSAFISEAPYTSGSNSSEWPIRNWAAIDICSDAFHGGCAGIIQCSNSYGGKGPETTAEIILYRSGFSGHHFGFKSIVAGSSGHFGVSNNFLTDENGYISADMMFGTNHVSLLTNDPQHGDLSHGIFISGKEQNEPTLLPININGAKESPGAGNTLVICTGCDPTSSKDDKWKFAIYMVRSGFKDDFQEAKFICGDDKWKFGVSGERLSVTGLDKSQYGIYHNRNANIVKKNLTNGSVSLAGGWMKPVANIPLIAGAVARELMSVTGLDKSRNIVKKNLADDTKAFAGHAKSFNGEVETPLFKTTTNQGAVMVMCSNTSSTKEDASCAALYCITFDSSSKKLTTKYVSGHVGIQYNSKNPDRWNFSANSGLSIVSGPTGPCRYGFLTNLPRKACNLVENNPGLCLATGNNESWESSVVIDKEKVVGWISKKLDVHLSNGQSEERVILSNDLKDLGEKKWGFCYKWTEDEMRPGLKLIQVSALDHCANGGNPVAIELKGSPRRVVHNFPGVIYSVNCSGSDYESEEGIIYESEFTRFASYIPDFNSGSACIAGGWIKPVAKIPQMIAGTVDGHMFAWHRTPFAEPVKEQHVKYKIEGLANGEYTLRLNMVLHNCGHDFKINGERASEKINSQLSKIKEVIPDRTAHRVDVRVTVKHNSLGFTGTEYCLSSFALLSPDFKEKQKTPEELDQDKGTSQKLMDTIKPLTRTMSRKARKLVGWSQNLLKNASAELNSLEFWETLGKFKIEEGGHGTEKAFATSHTWSSKQQTVDLLQHFSPEYLDTAPHIRVSESYREGIDSGGHYYFRAALLDSNGKTIKDHILPETKSLYRNKTWFKEEANFKDYGPGVRKVLLHSKGKDDRFWAGHYGAMMSAAEVRVQRERQADKDDAFAEIFDFNNVSVEKEKELVRKREDLIARIFREKADLLQDLADEHNIVEGEPGQLTKVGKIKKQKQRKKREMRVFLSSTFRDFKAEREELIKKTFREIYKMCADRGVSFSYVDLRWGVTTEQSQFGETIAICLREIDRCRPYFLCMVGERYGWSQKTENSDADLDKNYTYAVKNFPKQLGWLDDHRVNTSVTKLEILYGVLNDVEKSKNHGYFYIREPVEEGDFFIGELSDMRPESDWHKEKQYGLRNELLNKKELNVKKYKGHLDGCSKIKADLEKCLNEDFPIGTELSALAREREAHMAFAEARQRVYIGREEYFRHIDNFIKQKTNQPLVILGESGSGKSALMANWAWKAEQELTNAFIFLHFIGSSAESASYLKLLRRLYEEMREFYGFEMSVPQTDQNLVQDLSTWLKLAGSVKEVPCILVLDALNQLEAESGGEGAEHDLMWLPNTIPPGVTILLSTLPGRTYNAVEMKGWPSMRVEPLDQNEKLQIVTEYMEGIYGKTLDANQKPLIVNAPQTNNPLYLKALLDEVRIHGEFETLTHKIEDYLKAQNPPELFAKILSRLENDFEKTEESKDLVRKTASAIWCSNKGMTEPELLAMLKITSPVWSPFYLSVIDNLVNRNGVVNFFHDHLRQAVEAKYLPTDPDKKQGYIDLAKFFSTQDISDRVVEELPFLLAKAGDKAALKSFITQIEVFMRLIKTEDGKFNLIRCWTMLGEFNQVEEAYNDALNYPGDMFAERMEEVKQELAQFYVDLGLFPAARSMFEELLAQVEARYAEKDKMIMYDPNSQSFKCIGKHPIVIKLLKDLGSVCEKQKDSKKASLYYRDAINRQRRINNPEAKLKLAESLLGEATVLVGQGDAKEASFLLLRCQELAKDVLGPNHHYVSAIVNKEFSEMKKLERDINSARTKWRIQMKLGQLAFAQGRVEEALRFYVQDLRLTKSDVGTSHPRIAQVLNDVALAYDEVNDPLAGRIYEAALYILLSLYGESHLDVACLRFNLGSFYFATNSFARSKYQYVEALNVYEKFLGSDHPDTIETKKALQDISAFVV